MRALVAGGAGFIGSHIVEALLDRGDDVIAVDDLSTGLASNLPTHPKLRFVEGNLSDYDVLKGLFQDVQVVFHEAALPSVPLSIVNPLATHFRGSHLTALLLDAARKAGVSRFIHAGSASAYPEFELGRSDPKLAPSPISPYAAEKVAAEFLVAGYAKSYSMDGCSLRYFNVYGPRQSPSSPYSGVISKFCEAVSKGKPLTIFGNGRKVRDFVYVKDVVAANLAAADAPGRLNGIPINVGTGSGTTILELANELGRVVGYTPPIRFCAGREGELEVSIANVDGPLPFKAATSLHDGLKATYEWYVSCK